MKINICIQRAVKAPNIISVSPKLLAQCTIAYTKQHASHRCPTVYIESEDIVVPVVRFKGVDQIKASVVLHKQDTSSHSSLIYHPKRNQNPNSPQSNETHHILKQ